MRVGCCFFPRVGWARTVAQTFGEVFHRFAISCSKRVAVQFPCTRTKTTKRRVWPPSVQKAERVVKTVRLLAVHRLSCGTPLRRRSETARARSGTCPQGGRMLKGFGLLPSKSLRTSHCSETRISQEARETALASARTSCSKAETHVSWFTTRSLSPKARHCFLFPVR